MARCSKCLCAWPNTDGCVECNPDRLTEVIAELKERVRVADDATYDRGYAEGKDAGSSEAEDEAADEMLKVCAALAGLLWRSVADQDDHDGCTADDPLDLCMAWRALGYGDHWPGWKKAQAKLGPRRGKLKDAIASLAAGPVDVGEGTGHV